MNPDTLPPIAVIAELARAIPKSCHPFVIIIGSVAAGYYFFKDQPERTLRTKDVDCMFSPNAKAVVIAQDVTEQLFASKWTMRTTGDWTKPGTADQADDQLPLVRLNPPGSDAWFIELMGAPEQATTANPQKKLARLKTTLGDFALCSFGYLGLVEWNPIVTEFGIQIARPDMMALANLLHHPAIGPETMSGSEFGNQIKRSNKDLGRVLALAYLTPREELDTWHVTWLEALQSKYPDHANELTMTVGTGLRALLESPEDMDQALVTCNRGLLASMNIRMEMLLSTGQVLLNDVIQPLEKRVGEVR